MTTREEMLNFIKVNNLKEKANELAHIKIGSKANYTNLSNYNLRTIIDEWYSKAVNYPDDEPEIIDSGARRAIIALARAVGLNGIEKNF